MIRSNVICRCLATMMFGLAIAATAPLDARAQTLLLQSTTSVKNSGLLDALLPKFEQATGIDVNVVAVGTGQAINNARRCDADLLWVHDPAAEQAFIDAGFGLSRHPIMHNDFVLIGPESDPAQAGQASTTGNAFQRIAQSGERFISRGDDSGTHARERAIWRGTGLDPTNASGQWYLETGSGMGATLNIAVELQGYALTDRASWLKHGRTLDLTVLYASGPELFNPYSVITINPAHCPDHRFAAADTLTQWLLSQQGQQAIQAYQIRGQHPFTPLVHSPER